ncbi:MAG: hypothetical protein ACLQO1_05375 [Steroidobacteraceae bacterium]
MADSNDNRQNVLKDQTPVHREEIFKKTQAERADKAQSSARGHGAPGH